MRLKFKVGKEEMFPLAKAGWETRALLFILIHLWVVMFFVAAAIGGAAGASGEGTVQDLLLALAIMGLVGVGTVGVPAGLCYAFAPAAYVLDAEGLKVVRRLVQPVSLPYELVRGARIERFATAPSVTQRRLGSWPPQGMFAYYGRFKADRLGWIRVYATFWKGEMVVVETGREPWYLSPAEPDRFCAALRERLGANGVTQQGEAAEGKLQAYHSDVGGGAVRTDT